MVFLSNAAKLERLKEDEISLRYYIKARLRVSQNVPDHVTFSNQVTCLGNLVQTELPIKPKPNQITFA